MFKFFNVMLDNQAIQFHALFLLIDYCINLYLFQAYTTQACKVVIYKAQQIQLIGTSYKETFQIFAQVLLLDRLLTLHCNQRRLSSKPLINTYVIRQK